MSLKIILVLVLALARVALSQEKDFTTEQIEQFYFFKQIDDYYDYWKQLPKDDTKAQSFLIDEHQKEGINYFSAYLNDCFVHQEEFKNCFTKNGHKNLRQLKQEINNLSDDFDNDENASEFEIEEFYKCAQNNFESFLRRNYVLKNSQKNMLNLFNFTKDSPDGLASPQYVLDYFYVKFAHENIFKNLFKEVSYQEPPYQFSLKKSYEAFSYDFRNPISISNLIISILENNVTDHILKPLIVYLSRGLSKDYSNDFFKYVVNLYSLDINFLSITDKKKNNTETNKFLRSYLSESLKNHISSKEHLSYFLSIGANVGYLKILRSKYYFDYTTFSDFQKELLTSIILKKDNTLDLYRKIADDDDFKVTIADKTLFYYALEFNCEDFVDAFLEDYAF
ncbi:MAG TPA: hypothetical protein VI959_01405, partial [Alphaproteobacteria bacterium]|nr:hypothetical protein [Alphaproteobacteria bacterium]